MEAIKNKKMKSGQILDKRKKIIELYKKKMPVMKIVEKSGLSWPAVNTAIKLYVAGGMDALPPKMGKTQGSGRILSPEQEDEIKNILYTMKPQEIGIIYFEGTYTRAPKEDELINEISENLMNNLPTKELWATMRKKLHGDYPQALWCRDSVKELITLKSGKELSPRGVSKYLLRWGFPKTKQNQRPIARCSQEIQWWLNDKPLSDESSKIYWLYRERLKTETKRSIISATDNHRKVLWTVIQGNFSQKKQIEFLHALARQSRQRITVIRNDYKHYTKKS
ncbi:MAG: hypothetical protein DRP47_11505, partial [Candidatus Zixiibacteriota bacterium]